VRSHVRDYGLMRVRGNNLMCRALLITTHDPVEIAARIVTIHLRTASPGKTSNCSDAGPDCRGWPSPHHDGTDGIAACACEGSVRSPSMTSPPITVGLMSINDFIGDPASAARDAFARSMHTPPPMRNLGAMRLLCGVALPWRPATEKCLASG
jgi:hypothetical protein